MATNKTSENFAIESKFNKLLSQMNKYKKLSDEYANYNENYHEQIANIHYQGRVAREKLNNVRNYKNKFASNRKNNLVRSNALAYIKNVENSMNPPTRSHDSTFMSNNTGGNLKWV